MSNYPPTVAAQPTTTANPLLQRHQSEQRRRELPKIVETESTSMDITIGQSKQPQFLKSIDELAAFSVAVETFKRQFDDLQKHIESIENAIDSKLESNGVVLAARNNNFHQPMLSPPRNNVSVETTVTVSQPSQEIVPETSNKPEGGRMCELMCSKGLRKYIYANISDQAKLMEEIPSALKLAKEPAKFVLDCIGKFYLQGRRAFTKESPMSSARQVSLLILESFLLMPDRGKGKVKIESWIKDEAETAAVAWRKRLMTEGGLAAAEKMDARGLLLLVACFGVPSNFRSTDLLDLIRMSGSNEIAGALKRSQFLVPMVSGIVESSIKRGMHIEALEMVYTFGMEDKFSAALVLTSFLKMSKESFERAKRKAQSPLAFKEAATKQLAVLSSVMQCMETHKLDPAKELPGWQIKEQIVSLEKDTLQLDKEMEEKARSLSLMEEAALAKRMYNQQIKRPRLSPMEMPPVTSSSYSPIYRDRSFPSQRDDDQDEISALVSSYLGPSTSFPHRSRRSPEYMVPLPHGGLGRSVYAYEHLAPNSYSPGHGHRLHRQYSPSLVHGQRHPLQYSPPIHGQQQLPYGIQRVYRHSPSEERYLGLSNQRSPRSNSSLDPK
ncbi:Protein FRIGIDA [Arabidopsis thaliana]|uniref:Protein FRIGIDA n=2 Tax=Arabidopsis thaliana TaxID=3702 RepID=FRIGI_ARATH|nr:RecName: Full=Protein FRIGIDA [Arabidopsis thaliana]AAG23414.1 FRIGIDA [Arabidopsis thaliana]AAG23415.1 FRIGIDA [Arabidopsis thaliana]AAX97726.1 FRIGIDA [Arabidopsis thaliana]AEM06757.1 FRIGIDA [Arabidopsis thaliana]AEM06760.1 FRIGIDA [Arabidopsis thaliana]